MKKAPKIEYGIEIVKPWSKEMYDHNFKVADEVRNIVKKKWEDEYKTAEAEYDAEYADEDFTPEGFEYAEWQDNANIAMMDLHEAVIVVGYGSGFEMHQVDEDFHNELETAGYWRMKEIAEELDIKLDKGFIGLK